MSTSAEDLPPELMRNGRPVDQAFELVEELYRRVTLIGWPADDSATGLALPFPDMSVNRQKYCSDPRWVLLPSWPEHGVLAFRVQDIPARLEQAGMSYVFEFQPIHDPEEENYSHTEIRTYRDGIHDKKIEPPKTIRKKFRQMLAEKARLLVSARV